MTVVSILIGHGQKKNEYHVFHAANMKPELLCAGLVTWCGISVSTSCKESNLFASPTWMHVFLSFSF